MSRIAIASDHAGFLLKEHLRTRIQMTDFGTFSAEVSVDYPDYANNLVGAMLRCEVDFGILICGTGIGVSIAANRHKKIRAALCHNIETARLAREHNNANILCLGARFIGEALADEIVASFFATQFAGGRHVARVDKLL